MSGHPALDKSFDPIELFIPEPYSYELCGTKFLIDYTVKVSQKCNELGLRGLKVTKISMVEAFQFTSGNGVGPDLREKGFRVILEVEATR